MAISGGGGRCAVRAPGVLRDRGLGTQCPKDALTLGEGPGL